MADDLDAFNFTNAKKKRKAVKKREANASIAAAVDKAAEIAAKEQKAQNPEGEGAPAAEAAGPCETVSGEEPWTYTYEALVDRVFTFLSANKTDEKKTLLLPPPRVYREGKKKSIWSNFAVTCSNMNRPMDHVNAFICAELGTTASIDGNNRLVIRDSFQPKQVQKVLRNYIKEYVMCKNCGKPDTRLVKENRMYFVHCNSCDSKKAVGTIKKGFEAVVTKRRK